MAKTYADLFEGLHALSKIELIESLFSPKKNRIQ